MKYIFICSLFLFNHFASGQNAKYQPISNLELKIINDLSSTLDTSISFVLSPIVISDFYNDIKYSQEVIVESGFSESQFKSVSKDTFMIDKNRYFKVISPDSLIKYRTATVTFRLKNRGREDVNIFADQVLEYIKNQYQKRALCTFYKPIVVPSKKYAIASFYIDCGFMCGSGETVLLKSKKGKWVVVKMLSFVKS